jgi:hypothetical protein
MNILANCNVFTNDTNGVVFRGFLISNSKMDFLEIVSYLKFNQEGIAMFRNKIFLWSFCCALAITMSGCVASSNYETIELEKPGLDVAVSKGDLVRVVDNSYRIFTMHVTSIEPKSKIIGGKLVDDKSYVQFRFDEIDSLVKVQYTYSLSPRVKKDSKEMLKGFAVNFIPYLLAWAVFLGLLF